MSHVIRLCLLLSIVIPVIHLPADALADEADDSPSARQIVARVDSVARAESSEGIVLQTITTTGGEEREFRIRVFTKDGNDKMLFRYLEPARVEGVSFLMLDDGKDIWSYFPSTDRVRHLASHVKRQKMMGSDFSYEDMGSSSSFAADYDATLAGTEDCEGNVCYHLTLTPYDSDCAYSRVEIWADTSLYVPLRVDYYDDDGELLKRLLVADIRIIDAHPTPMHYVMTNLQDDSRTTMRIVEIEYDIDLPDAQFTTSELKKR